MVTHVDGIAEYYDHVAEAEKAGDCSHRLCKKSAALMHMLSMKAMCSHATLASRSSRELPSESCR